jgi:hypothetical protein
MGKSLMPAELGFFALVLGGLFVVPFFDIGYLVGLLWTQGH